MHLFDSIGSQCVMAWTPLSLLQIFMLDTEEQSRSEADGQAWKEDAQWASILDQDWDLQGVRQVPCLPSTLGSEFTLNDRLLWAAK